MLVNHACLLEEGLLERERLSNNSQPHTLTPAPPQLSRIFAWACWTVGPFPELEGGNK
jgi:hypothetical protein